MIYWLPTAALGKKKNRVIGVDINNAVVDIVNNGEVHIIEKGLQSLVKDVVNEGYLLKINHQRRMFLYWQFQLLWEKRKWLTKT